ncbi:MAG: hypothetical protein A2623_01710 [Caulobacterales bacterium RIFCSPHIGHO2_01_FULL_70_19]|jgi:hypothetical protein|nr:MAG: hypothetical protein A2623_01710 [Caulobacterales bacterium RIFCSPHIGHO2_01_FULL_70_19]
MRSLHFHLPHLRPRKAATSEGEHRRDTGERRLWRLEQEIDYLVVLGAVILAAAMVYGLATASGDARWY